MRLFDDENLSVGDEIELINNDDGEVFSRVVITEVLTRKLGEVDDIDLDGHEKWKNKEEMLKSLRKYYGDRVSEDTDVKIVRFKII